MLTAGSVSMHMHAAWLAVTLSYCLPQCEVLQPEGLHCLGCSCTALADMVSGSPDVLPCWPLASAQQQGLRDGWQSSLCLDKAVWQASKKGAGMHMS